MEYYNLIFVVFYLRRYMPLPTTLDKHSPVFIIIIIVENYMYDEVSLKCISALSLKLVLWTILSDFERPK